MRYFKVNKAEGSTEYFLVVRRYSTETAHTDRVVLDNTVRKDDKVLDSVLAKNWLDARINVDMTKLYHYEGYGYII